MSLSLCLNFNPFHLLTFLFLYFFLIVPEKCILVVSFSMALFDVFRFYFFILLFFLLLFLAVLLLLCRFPYSDFFSLHYFLAYILVYLFSSSLSWLFYCFFILIIFFFTLVKFEKAKVPCICFAESSKWPLSFIYMCIFFSIILSDEHHVVYKTSTYWYHLQFMAFIYVLSDH